MYNTSTSNPFFCAADFFKRPTDRQQTTTLLGHMVLLSAAKKHEKSWNIFYFLILIFNNIPDYVTMATASISTLAPRGRAATA